MAENTAKKEPTFAWGDLDEQFDDPKNYELESVFDSLVARQADEYGPLLEPCAEAQELLDQWQIDDEYDYLPDWRAAVARRAPKVAGATLNDSFIRGTETAGLADFLARNATFLLGEMWGARDRRNTQDGDWKSVTLTWGQWIGGQAGGSNAPAWGFSRHPVGKDKAGASIVLGSSIGGARKAKAMSEMYAMGLDVDSGAKLDDVITTIEELGLLCFVYTSFNHGKRGIELKRDDVLRKLHITRDPEEHEIRHFLREHDKNRYEETFIAGCTIKEQKSQTTEGVKIVLDTPPLEKFRLIFPLAEPVKLIDLADTQQAALDLWEDKITGLARNTLGVHFDTSCTDPSRLFYTARHKKGADDWYCAIVQGDPLSFDDITPLKKSSYTSKRESNAFTMAGGEEDDRPPMAIAPSGKSLNDWHTRYKGRFMVADLLETLCSDKVRVAGGEAQGHVHTECPFEHEHTSEGGTATMAINCCDSQNEYWTWFCHHDSCQGRHKLQFLEEALRAGWFDESELTNLDSGFLLEVGGGEPDPFESEEVKKERGASFEERAGQFEYTANAVDVAAFITEAHAAGIEDAAIRERINKSIVKATALGLPTVRDMWEKCDRTATAERRKVIAEKRRKSAPAPFIELEKATAHTVEKAAENAAWLPPFMTYKNGWFYARDFDKPDSAPRRICRAFEVPYVAFGETEEGRTNEITIRYRHRSAQRGIVESTYRIGDTYRESGSFVSRLVDEGFEVDPLAKTEIVVSLLRSVNTDNEAVLVEKSGWHGDTYVSPAGVVVNGGVHHSCGPTRYILNPKARVSGKTRGTLEQNHMYATTALCGVNGKLFLPAYLTGLTGCLVDFIENDVSPVITLEGDSTKGKTSAAKAGVSHFGPPDNTGLFTKADQTATATEIYAERANGAGLALDEGGAAKLDARDEQRLVLQLGDGSGRGRGTQDMSVRRTKTWRSCFVKSAEQGFLNRLSAEGHDPLTGAVARIFSVNYDGAADLASDSDELAAIRALSGDDSDKATYGITGPIFAQKLAEIGREEVRGRVSGVMDEWADLATGAARRVVRLASIFTVTGEIAQEAGIFGKEVPVRANMRALLEETIEARMGHLDTDRQQVDTLRRAILRGLQTGDVVSMHEPPEFNRREILGYHGHLTDNGRLKTPPGINVPAETEIRDRVYILPLDRLSKLGIKTSHKALAKRVQDEGGLIPRMRGGREQWFHEYVPGEGGGIKNIRVTGAFVHGDEEE
ncbi:MAG: DUF927 domain-containing protein [Roseovarius sp.]|jgi:hypothetical protein|nr:DUF927 domain-containing protein [Roseovarius sp.]